jgi:acyl-coenzyme A thioesterase PaaI-like protein
MNRPYDPAADGWRALPGGLGVPWARREDGHWLYGLQTTDAHANPNGTVHGGTLMAFADHGLSILAWEAAERGLCTTIHLNTHFLDAVRPDAFVILRGEIAKRTRGLVFLRGVISAREAEDSRDIASVDGIWRILRPR